MATTGSANAYVLNITELQNTVTTASGLSPYATLSDQIGQIQEMVIYGEKRIAVNTISAYNTTPIQVTAPLNITTVGGLTVSGQAVSSSTGTTGTGPTGPTGPTSPTEYVPPTPSIWVGSAPTTTQDAINRMANLLYTLNLNVPIP